MTVEEHNACNHFRINSNDGNNYNNNNDDNSYEKRLMIFKHRNNNVNHDYGNCNFVLGSSAVVECLWFMANKLLDVNRSRTSPLLME